MKAKAVEKARGRLAKRKPVAIIDIGSNSVRQVVYEGLMRSPSILFNEKVLCGLGVEVARNRNLDAGDAERAKCAVARFLALGRQLNVRETFLLATAAVREAENGAAFMRDISTLAGKNVHILTGPMEACYAALGIKSGFYKPAGLVGDLGGGSTELIPVSATMPGNEGVSVPLGGLQLREESGGDLGKARSIVCETLSKIDFVLPQSARVFYAVGGTWRSLARLHMLETKYPLEIIHGYSIDAKTCRKFCEKLASKDYRGFESFEYISKKRRDLLPFGAIVLSEIINKFDIETVTASSVGLREGYLYSLLDEELRERDALLEATKAFSILRARSPAHSRELAKWTEHAFEILGLEECECQKRWRIAACNLADIAWRSVSGFRAEQTLGIINNAGLNALSHEGRVYLALVGFHHYQGLGSGKKLPPVGEMASGESVKLARIVAAIFRVLYLFSAGEAGIVPRLDISRNQNGKIVFHVPEDLTSMIGEKPLARIQQLGRELDRKIMIVSSKQSK